MLARVEKPMTREEWRNATPEQKIEAIGQLAQEYIVKYEEVKQPYLLRYARRLQYKAQMLAMVNAGVSPSRKLRHYEKGDFANYCEAVADLCKSLINGIKLMCIMSREHGYAFNPSSVNVWKLLKLYTLAQIPKEVAESEVEDKTEDPSDVVEDGLLKI